MIVRVERRILGAIVVVHLSTFCQCDSGGLTTSVQYQNILTPLTNQTQLARITRTADSSRGMHADEDPPMEKPKSKPWLGYYDFLITEGSYKFWVVFELFTCALLVYSAFSALYYAKYTITDYDDYEDYFFRRSTRSVPNNPDTFLGMSPRTFNFILEAVEMYNKLNS